MTVPTLEDLSVCRRDAEVFEVSSWLTRGRCATVYKFAFSERMSVRPFLIPSYMQGITTGLILGAVESFLANERAIAAKQSGLTTEFLAG